MTRDDGRRRETTADNQRDRARLHACASRHGAQLSKPAASHTAHRCWCGQNGCLAAGGTNGQRPSSCRTAGSSSRSPSKRTGCSRFRTRRRCSSSPTATASRDRSSCRLPPAPLPSRRGSSVGAPDDAAHREFANRKINWPAHVGRSGTIHGPCDAQVRFLAHQASEAIGSSESGALLPLPFRPAITLLPKNSLEPQRRLKRPARDACRSRADCYYVPIYFDPMWWGSRGPPL